MLDSLVDLAAYILGIALLFAFVACIVLIPVSRRRKRPSQPPPQPDLAEVHKLATRLAQEKVASFVGRTLSAHYFSQTAVVQALNTLTPSAVLSRFQTANTKNVRFAEITPAGKAIGSQGEVYHVTLNSCTCPDFQTRKIPCKHMLKLAMELGVLSSVDTTAAEQTILRAAQREKFLSAAFASLEKQKKELQKVKKDLQKLKDSSLQTFPYLSGLFAEYEELQDRQTADALRKKHYAAPKAAAEVSRLAGEKASLIRQNKDLSHQLQFYEALFPWLEEFKELDPKEAYPISQGISPAEAADRQAASDYWIPSPLYEKLSTPEKLQLALDRYCASHKKTNWQAGIDYERYIGYLLENKGYLVDYTGATQGFSDMGRDLVARSGQNTYIIQCKRWKETKQIHEKHIFQLFGTLVLYQVHHPGETAKGVFVSTCPLSETAKSCAEYLSITYVQQPFDPDYPRIKCNISRHTGEKIYHLPFDQQYDRIHIPRDANNFYAFTIAEAESQGFRHAYCHNLGSAQSGGSL